MNSPPCQLATTVVDPENRSIVTSMLGPAWPGVWVADQETIRWVTSWGDQGPLRVHSFCGWVASETSASTIDGEPCITSSASWAAGCPVQFADMAAQVGRGVGLGKGEGEGEGVGLGVGEGEGDGDGLGRAAADVEPQPATRIVAASASSPTLRLTGHRNDEAGGEVTDRPRDTGRQG